MTDYFHVELDRAHLLEMSSLGLAHLGDAVYELMVRSWVCLHGQARVRDIHKASVGYVAAPAQALRFLKIEDRLTSEEQAVFKRGRNVSPHAVPKSASRSEYQTATGLESLFGWLWLQGRTERLNELFSAMMEGDSPEEQGRGEH